MSDQDFKQKMFNQLKDIADKNIEIERKIDTIHSGIYGDINYKGLKSVVDAHDKDIEKIKDNTRPLSWVMNNILLSIAILMIFIDIVLEFSNHGLIGTILKALV